MNKPFAITLDAKSSLNNKTGSWRNRKPVYIDRIPPCNMSCPAGHNIQAWLTKMQQNDVKGAWDILVENNPFPAVMGRVCYHPCELGCNRGHYDSSVNINLTERYIGDVALKEGWKFDKMLPDTGKKVLIIGAGPAGLTAAYFLRNFGHSVTIVEEKSKLGGMMRYGIPSYRLSRETLDGEINRILAMGVDVKTNFAFPDLNEVRKEYDAIFIGTGAHVATKINVELTGGQVFDAVDVLRKIEDEGAESVKLGKNVIVYGGGNTAVDVARTAIRLGCQNVKIVYRRTFDVMPAHKSELEEALAEGVEILCLRLVKSISDGKVLIEHVNCENDALTPSGNYEEIAADSVIFAVGQSINQGLFKDVPEIKISDKGVIEIDDQMMTGAEGIFAGGDVTPAKRTVTTAIGNGKKAAKCINAFLQGGKYVKPAMHEVVTVKKLNLNYYEHSEGQKRTLQTSKTFDEIGQNFSHDEAVFEAKRCMSCGNCMSCNNCMAICPDGAIKRDENGLYIDYDYCKGCGICERECPCGSIKMEAEDK